VKHILNDLTDQEKNAIREQHSGGMKVRTEKFHRLLGSKLGDVKPLVNESAQANQMVQEAMSNAKNPKNKNMMVAITNCIKENKFTHLAILTTGAGATILGSLAALFVSGVGTLPALLLLAAGVIITTIEGLLTSKEANLGGSSVTQELQQLIGCLKKKGAL
jgi:hypothetical protein